MYKKVPEYWEVITIAFIFGLVNQKRTAAKPTFCSSPFLYIAYLRYASTTGAIRRY